MPAGRARGSPPTSPGPGWARAGPSADCRRRSTCSTAVWPPGRRDRPPRGPRAGHAHAAGRGAQVVPGGLRHDPRQEGGAGPLDLARPRNRPHPQSCHGILKPVVFELRDKTHNQYETNVGARPPGRTVEHPHSGESERITTAVQSSPCHAYASGGECAARSR